MTSDRTPRLSPIVLAISAALLAVVAVWGALDNPEIDNTSRGDAYQCPAPWDSVLNEDSNYPPGEPPEDGDQIAARCHDAGEGRFRIAVACAIAAFAAGAGAGGLASRRERRRASPR